MFAVPAGLLMMLMVLGCGRNKDLESKHKKAKDERAEKAKGEVGTLISEYAAGLNENLPPPDAKGQLRKDHPMKTWRLAAAERNLAAKADKRAQLLKATPSAEDLRDAGLLFAAIKKYWLGKEVERRHVKKVYEEGHEESKKLAAKEGARDKLTLDEYVKMLRGLGAKPPLDEVAEFEELLPHIIHSYQYRLYPGDSKKTFFSQYWQALYALPRLKEKNELDQTVLEQYAPYRDRLCKLKLAGKCDVPYEWRDVAARGAFMETLIARLDAFDKKHPDSELKPLTARFRLHLQGEVEKSRVPEEYPDLPTTVSLISASADTMLIAGPKGLTMEADEPGSAEGARRIVTLIKEGDPMDLLDEETVKSLQDTFKSEMRKLADDGGLPRHTTEVYIHFDRTVKLKVLDQISSTFGPLGILVVDFVARRRSDGSRRLRGLKADVVGEAARTPLKVPVGGAAWTCRPLASISAIPKVAEGYLMADATTITGIVKKGNAVKVSQPMSSKLEKVGEWARGQKRIIVGLKEDLTYGQLHKVMNLMVPADCKDSACVIQKMTGRTIAICK